MFHNVRVGNLDTKLVGYFELSFVMVEVGNLNRYKFRGYLCIFVMVQVVFL
jgi:hypothetical protein